MLYPLLFASFAITTYDFVQDFHFYHKTKRKAVDNIGAMFREGIQGRAHTKPELFQEAMIFGNKGSAQVWLDLESV